MLSTVFRSAPSWRSKWFLLYDFDDLFLEFSKNMASLEKSR